MAGTAERVVTLMSREEKSELDRKAKRASRQWGRKVSTAEIVREAVKAFDPESRDDEIELKALLAAFDATHPQTIDALDRAEKALDDALAYFEGKAAAR